MSYSMKKSHTLTLGAVSVLAFFAVAIFLFSGKEKEKTTDSDLPLYFPSTSVSMGAPDTIPQGTLQYKNNRYRFSLFYPQELTVQEFEEGGGASSITFEDVSGGKGFQIFIVPYAENQVSKERFEKDVPSGVRSELREGIVGGAKAAFFYSKNDSLGDTREVWFIYDGFLYEVTTFRNLDLWLFEIIKTWRFFPDAGINKTR